MSEDEVSNLPEDYITLGRRHGQPFHPDLPTIRYQLASDHSAAPPICHGRMGFDTFVNEMVKSLIEEMDPGTHFFHPLILYSQTGDVMSDQHYLLRVGDLVDGIDVDNSEVEKDFVEGRFFRYQRCTLRPKILWRKEIIAGRHFWMDKYFINNYYCSDEFMDQLRQRKMTNFIAIPSHMSE